MNYSLPQRPLTSAHLRPSGLLVALLLTGSPVRSQEVTLSPVGAVMGAFRAGTRPIDIVQGAPPDCDTFDFEALSDSLRAQVKRAPTRRSAAEDVLHLYRRSCAWVRIAATPMGVQLRLAARDYGTLRDSLRYFAVGAEGGAIDLRSGADSVRRRVSISRGQAVKVTAELRRDTLPLPRIRSAADIAESQGILSRYRQVTAPPLAPIEPVRGSAWTGAVIWGLLGAGAGYATAAFLPSVGCVDSRTFSQDAYVRGQLVPAGSSVDLGKGTGCTATLAAGAGLGVGLLQAWLSARAHTGRLEAYNADKSTYDGRLAQWKLDDLRQWAAEQAEVKQGLAGDRDELERAAARNRQIVERNRQLPTLSVSAPEDLVREELTGDRATTLAVATLDPLSAVDRDIPVAVAPNRNAIALVIGNRDYRRVPKVEYAERDAYFMRQYFARAFGIDSSSILYYADLDGRGMERLLGRAGGNPQESQLGRLLATRMGGAAATDVYIFYSGHGAPGSRAGAGGTQGDLQAYLLPVDVDPAYLATEGYPVEQLYATLAAVKPRSVFIALDACFSGQTDGGSVFGATSAILEVNNPIAQIRNAVVITAAGGKEFASWNRDEQHGAFSYFLMNALRGAADANGSGEIRLSNLRSYLAERLPAYVVKASGRLQTPDVQTTRTDDPIVVRLSKEKK